MDYETLHLELQIDFPELKRPIENLQREWSGEKPGQYIVYEDIFGDMIRRLIMAEPSHNRNTALARAFRHVDRLLAGEGEVANLGFVAMLEGKPEWWYARARNFLSKNAKEALTDWRPEWVKWTDQSIGNVDVSHDLYGVQQVVTKILSAPSAKPPNNALDQPP